MDVTRADRHGRPPRTGNIFFNSGHYFEAHEAWEDLWRDTADESSLLYQGLIHAAVGLHHLEKGNSRGGYSQLRKALAKLEPYGTSSRGIDLRDLVSQLRSILADRTSGPPAIRRV